MKLFKKTAALLFCLALVFSVMAISASAEDGGYSVELKMANDDIKDWDENGKYEIVANDNEAVTYDIILKSETATDNINSIEFTMAAITGLTPTVTLGVNGGAADTTQINGTHYAFYPDEDGSEDITAVTGDTGVKIGAISFAVGAVTADTDITVTLSNITIGQRPSGNDNTTVPVGYALENASAYLEVKATTYTITFDEKQATAAGNFAITDNTTDTTQTYAFTTGATLNEATFIGGYHFTQWDVEGWTEVKGNGGWTQTHADKAVIPPRYFGNVKLTPTYTLQTYTITYNYSEDVDGTATSYNTVTNSAKTTYQITDLVSDGSALNLDTTHVTRKGYTLVGWTASQASNATHDEYNGDVWNTLTANSLSVSGLIGAYGDVTLTPYWSIVGLTARASYAYAYEDDELLLYAVPEGSVAGIYSYKIGDAAPVEMYDVDDAKYLSAFSDVADFNVSETYKVFAYIIPTNTENNDISFRVTEGTTYNTPIAYTGDIFGDNGLNAADYGNINTMLGSHTAFAQTAVTVEQRLMVDRYSPEDGDNAETWFGSILDVRAVIQQLAGV